MQSELEDGKVKRARENEEWPEVHKREYAKHGIPYPGDTMKTMALFPHAAALTMRQCSLVNFEFKTRSLEMQPELQPQYVWDANLSMDFHSNQKPAGNTASCLTGSSTPVLRCSDDPSKCRLLLGAEALQLQGLMVGDCCGIQGFTQAEQLELAGNAFSGGCFVVSFLALLILFADYIPNSGKEVDRLREEAREALLFNEAMEDMFADGEGGKEQGEDDIE